MGDRSRSREADHRNGGLEKGQEKGEGKGGLRKGFCQDGLETGQGKGGLRKGLGKGGLEKGKGNNPETQEKAREYLQGAQRPETRPGQSKMKVGSQKWQAVTKRLEKKLIWTEA